MLLINPATEQFGGILSRYVPVGTPIAVGTLAGYLKHHGFSVRVTDDEIEKLSEDNLDEHLEFMRPPYVFGVSILTPQAARSYEIFRLLRRRVPECKIIAGGIHATALPDEALDAGADFVIRGEGERPLVDLYRKILAGGDFRTVQSLSYRDTNGQTVTTPDAPLIENLDEIPMFPYELFSDTRYDRGFITSSRGCPYRCTYCSQRLMTGLSYRYRSAEKVVEELRILIEHFGQKHIIFYDDNFSVKKSRVIHLCELIVKAGLHKKSSFSVQTRADNLYEDLMPHLRSANFTTVIFGMETAVERLAEHIVKGETVAQHEEAIRIAKKWGIDVTLCMIFGLPTESHKDRMRSYKFIKEKRLGFTKFNNLIPYPGTKLYNEVKNTDRINVLPHWANFNSTLTATRSIFDPTPLPYVPEGTSLWELKRDIHRCNMGFYFSPKILLSVMLRKKGPGFVHLPKRWYLKPKELFEMGKIGSILLTNFIVALLPSFIGGSIFHMLNWYRGTLKIQLLSTAQLPAAIDGSLRKIRILSPRQKALAQ